MLAELGRRILLFAISVTLLSSILIGVLSAAGMPVPDLLVRYSSILALITGKLDAGTLINFTVNIGMGVATLFAFNVLSKLMGTGGVELQQAIGLKAIASYLAIWVPVANGISVIVYSISYLVSTIYPAPIASVINALAVAADGFLKFTALYYLASRTLGLPAE